MKHKEIEFNLEVGGGRFELTTGKLVLIENIDTKYKFAAFKTDKGYIIANVETGQRIHNDPQSSIKKAINEAYNSIIRNGNKVDIFIKAVLKGQKERGDNQKNTSCYLVKSPFNLKYQYKSYTFEVLN